MPRNPASSPASSSPARRSHRVQKRKKKVTFDLTSTTDAAQGARSRIPSAACQGSDIASEETTATSQGKPDLRVVLQGPIMRVLGRRFLGGLRYQYLLQFANEDDGKEEDEACCWVDAGDLDNEGRELVVEFDEMYPREDEQNVRI